MLRLNVFPVNLAEPSPSVHVSRRDPDRDSRLRDARKGYQTYLHHERSYVWATSGGTLSEVIDASDWQVLSAAELPSRVVAFGVRDGILEKLRGYGFERLPGRLESPLRLYRRRLNLAEQAFGTTLADGVGTFPVYALQEIVLGPDETSPGEVGLIVDIQVVNKLDIDLQRLSLEGMDLKGEKLKWQHRRDCGCGSEDEKGFAGYVAGPVTAGVVQVRRGRSTRRLSASCLAPTAHRRLIEDYVVRIGRLSEAQARSRLENALVDFRSVGSQWKSACDFASRLGSIDVFASATATLGDAIDLPSRPDGDLRFPRLDESATEPQLNFRYGTPLLGEAAGKGLRKHGPYDLLTTRSHDIDSLVLAAASNGKAADRLAGALAGGLDQFPGMARQFRLGSFGVRHLRFDGSTAGDYRAAAIKAAAEKPTLVWLVVPPRERHAVDTEDPYRAAKAVLVARGIPVQAIQSDRLGQPDESLQWIVSAAALQAYAKVGNVPYVLHDPQGKDELVLGIGRADITTAGSEERRQLFGAAVAFRQDGDFLYGGSTASVADRDTYEDLLASLIHEAVERYEGTLGKAVERVVVHIFKRTGRREVRAAERAMGSRADKVALLHVNRDSPLWMIDVRDDGSVRKPRSGTVASLALNDRLLITTDAKGLPRPLRLTLDSASRASDMDRLVDQVYGFTCLSWRTFNRTHDPSTILYGRLLAQKIGALLPHGFDPSLANAGLGDKPWFL